MGCWQWGSVGVDKVSHPPHTDLGAQEPAYQTALHPCPSPGCPTGWGLSYIGIQRNVSSPSPDRSSGICQHQWGFWQRSYPHQCPCVWPQLLRFSQIPRAWYLDQLGKGSPLQFGGRKYWFRFLNLLPLAAWGQERSKSSRPTRTVCLPCFQKVWWSLHTKVGWPSQMLDSPLPLVETFWRKAGVVIAQKESEICFLHLPQQSCPLFRGAWWVGR